MNVSYERRLQGATQVFDLTDHYAREQGVRGRHPRPVGPIKFYVVGEIIDGDRQDFELPLELVVQRNPSGYYLFFGTVRLPDGGIRQSYVMSGTYVVRVESRYYQPLEKSVHFPMTDPKNPTSLEVLPGYAYPFPTSSILPDQAHSKLPIKRGSTLLRGGVHHTDGRGIARARIKIQEPDLGEDTQYETDKSGQWALEIPDKVFPNEAPTDDQVIQRLKIRFQLPDPERPDETVEHVVNDVTVEWGQERSLAQTALRGWVLTGTGVGIPDATIRVDGFPGNSTTGEDGSWFYYFELNQPGQAVTRVDVSAELPDGSSQTQDSVSIMHRATVVVPTFRFV